GVADVEGCGEAAGDDVARAGAGLDLADGGDEAGAREGVALDLDDPLRGGGEGVAAKAAHGGGAGVVGLAGEDELHAGLADDGLDVAEGAVFALEDGALLDVELEVGECGVVEDGGG